jgi:hypothetical protein
MMSNLTLFKNNALAKLDPALLKKFNEDQRNINERVSVPSLVPNGKSWLVKFNGKEETLCRIIDGEKEPIQVLKAIVVGVNPNRSRSYYKGKYDPNNPAQPDCWSNDGRTPDKSIQSPCASKCEGCPMSVKGSAVDERNGNPTVACSQQKFIAVLPVTGDGQIWDQPLRLKLSITSLYDGQSPDMNKEGWFAFDQYLDMLRQGGIFNTALVVTKMKFHPKESYPKIIFSADELNENIAYVDKILTEKKAEIDDLTTRAFTPNGRDGVATDAPAPAANAPISTKAEEPEEEEDNAAAEAERKAAEKAAKKAARLKAAEDAAAAAAEAARRAALAADDEDEDEEEEEETPAPAPEPEKPRRTRKAKEAEVIEGKAENKQDTPAAANGALPNGLAALVGAWANTK